MWFAPSLWRGLPTQNLEIAVLLNSSPCLITPKSGSSELLIEGLQTNLHAPNIGDSGGWGVGGVPDTDEYYGYPDAVDIMDILRWQ